MELMDWEIVMVRWANSWAGINYFYDWAILFRAEYLWYVMMLAVALFPLLTLLPKFAEKKKKNLTLFFHAFFGALLARFVITEAIRFFWSRPRPFEVLDDLVLLLGHNGGGAFPSGHTALAFAVAMAVYYYYPKTSTLFFLAALSIGFGRIAMGLHWPTDILGGAVMGVLAAWVLEFLFKKLQYK